MKKKKKKHLIHDVNKPTEEDDWEKDDWERKCWNQTAIKVYIYGNYLRYFFDNGDCIDGSDGDGDDDDGDGDGGGGGSGCCW